MTATEPRLQLLVRRPIDIRIDASCLQPRILANLSLAEIANLPIPTDSGHSQVRDWFDVQGEPCDQVMVTGECSKVDRIGFQMFGGKLHVAGNCGDYLGCDLRSGQIHVTGSARDFTGANMRGGEISVDGDVRHDAGGRSIGAPTGMRGGTMIIAGDAGDYLAQRMRRGVIYVQGNAGKKGAWSMIAGTIVVLGNLHGDWGRGMKRGTVILEQPSVIFEGPQFSQSRVLELSFLPLVWRHLRQWSHCGIRIPTTRWVKRQVGDCTVGGRGEILVLDPEK